MTVKQLIAYAQQLDIPLPVKRTKANLVQRIESIARVSRDMDAILRCSASRASSAYRD